MPKSPSSQYGLKAQEDIDTRGIRVTNGPMRYKPISTPYIYVAGAKGGAPNQSAAPPLFHRPPFAAALAECAVLAHRRPAFHPCTCGLRRGAATTVALIGCWDQGRGARFMGRDRLFLYTDVRLLPLRCASSGNDL
jgi:hypothetical protein